MLTKEQGQKLYNELCKYMWENAASRHGVYGIIENFIEVETEDKKDVFEILRENVKRYYKFNEKVSVRKIDMLDGDQWANSMTLECKLNEVIIVVNRILEKLEMLHVD